MTNIDHQINFLQQTNKIVADPTPQIIVKVDNGATAHYFTQADAHALVDVQPKKMGPRVRLPDNITMDPEQVGPLPLTLPPSETETHVFLSFQNESLISVGQRCYDDCQSIFNKKSFQVLDKNKISF